MKKLNNVLKKSTAAILSAAMVVTMTPGGFVQAEATEARETLNDNDLRLWYTSPAPNSYDGWEQWALPIGNSSIGASVFGRVGSERIQLNEKSLWSGGPAEGRDYNGGNVESRGQNGAVVKQIQDYFREGNNSAATNLCKTLTGVTDDSGTNGYGYYLSYGNMYLDFNGMTESNATDYVRDLDLNTAVAGVSYNYGGVQYKRENFVSYPDNVLVTRLTADEKGTLDFKVRVEPDSSGGDSGKRTHTTTAQNGTITMAGQLSDNQLKFHSTTKVVNEDGSLKENSDGTIQVSGASTVTIYTSIGTDYKNDYPDYRTGQTAAELKDKIENYVDGAVEKGYDKVKQEHIDDYAEIFSRVDLDLGQEPSQVPTNELLSKYKGGSASEAERRELEVMLFQYGRYLTMGSSRAAREGEDVTLPANLQGIWVGSNNSAWHSDYHMNVNLQMNYWPTYVTNMAECADPLISYVDSLREPGRVTAEIYAGIKSDEKNPENGFMAHTQNNPYGWTCPGWDFDWGWSPAAVPWILQNCWEHYEYTGDLAYMKEKIYPMLKEEAVFYNQMLIKDENGKYVSSPSFSPEQGPKTNGNTYEQTLIWQLFTDAITAGKLCGEDENVLAEWKEKLDNLKGPIEIGDSGQIKEWYNETTFNKDEEGNNMGEGKNHRHLSHLLGLFPGDLISVDTPELMDAAVYSLSNRVDKTTGWGMGQRINSWARTGNGDHAYKLITDLFAGGILTNLWDTHTPYQIDGNFGMTSGVAEMLIQSNMGYINILPALPSAWAEGEVEGLIARGNFEVSMKWEKESPTEIDVLSQNGGEAVVQSEGISMATVLNEQGQPVKYQVLNGNKISFDTKKGQTYVIKNLIERNTVRTPGNPKAVRVDDNSVNFTWDSVNGENLVYNVYRQADGGTVQLIAENITKNAYVDQEAPKLLGTLKYQVRAVAGPVDDRKESKLSGAAVAEESEKQEMTGIVDDRDSQITYTGVWGQYSGEEGMIKNTTTFLEAPKGDETAVMKFQGVGIRVYGTVNPDRGKADIYIDDEKVGEADSYRSKKQNGAIIFEYIDESLAGSEHELKMVVTNTKNPASSKTKFEFDAFQVLDETNTASEVTVTSETGMTTLARADSTLQLLAEVDTLGSNKKVNWKVTDVSGNATNLAAIDASGVLTAGSENGIVKVTATSVLDSSKSASIDITIALPGKTELESEKKEFAVNNVQNVDDFAWTGSWATWNKDGVGDNGQNHDNLDKIETSETGATVKGSFQGTGIEIYGHKNVGTGKFNLIIDDNDPVEVDTSYTADYKNVLLGSVMDLEEKEHTFEIVTTGGKISLDYCLIYKPVLGGTTGLDKSELQSAIEAASAEFEERYTQASWSAYLSAYQEAVSVMNNSSSDQAAIEKAVTDLKTAGEELVERDESDLPKPDVTGKTAKAISREKDSIVLAWDTVDTAVNYEVYQDQEKEPAASTETNVVRISNLKPGSKYTFTVRVISRVGQFSDLTPIEVATAGDVDTEAPAAVTNLQAEGATASWTAATDNVGVAGYEVWVNGKRTGKTDKTSYDISGLDENMLYTLGVIAVDAAGNKSVPASITFTKGKNPVKAVSVDPCAAIHVPYGTAFASLGLPQKVSVQLSNGAKAQTDVVWNAAAYSSTKVGSQTITGTLKSIVGVQNTESLKATIVVTVGAKPTDKPGITPPAKLSGLKQKTQGTNWITLSWKKSADANGYLVYRYDTKTKKDVLLTTIYKNSTVSYKVRKVNGNKGSALKAATNYRFKVVPYKLANGTKVTGGAGSINASTATKAPTAKAVKASAKSAVVSWKKIKSSKGYQVVMSQKKSKGYGKPATLKKATKVKYKKSGLKRGKTYYFKVRTYKIVDGRKVYSAYSKPAKVRM